MQPMPVHSPDKMQMGARLPDLRDVGQVLLVFNEKTLKVGGIAAYLLSIATINRSLGDSRKRGDKNRICRFYRSSQKERRSGIYLKINIGGFIMNFDEFTLQDCMALYDFKNVSVVIENGHITELEDNRK